MGECCKYPAVKLTLGTTRMVNGIITSACRIDFPRGLFVACGGLSPSKAGIHALLANRYTLGSAFVARFFGIIDALLYLLCVPFMFIAYTILFIVGVISWILVGWTYCCAPPSVRAYLIAVGLFALLYVPTIFLVLLYLVLTPLQAIVPELTALALRIHAWY